MGDSLEDEKMADGINDAQNVLKIGFIYEKVDYLYDKNQSLNVLLNLELENG